MKNKFLRLTSLLIALSLVLLTLPSNIYANEYSDDSRLYIDFDEIDIVGIIDEYELSYLFSIEDEHLFQQFMETQRLMRIQSYAVEAYSLLMENFLTEVDGELTLVYPDIYAGAYVDYDTLVIQLSDISAESKALFWNILGHNAPIRFKQVEFSLNQLISFGEIFVDSIDVPIVSFGFDTLNNNFNIVLHQDNVESSQLINSFDSVARFMPIPISFELGLPNEASALTGGTQINRVGSNFSVGLTGWTFRSGAQAALLTTGHAFVGQSAGTRIYRSGTGHIGYLEVARFGSSVTGGGQIVNVGNPGTTSGDWAVIRLNATGARLTANRTRCGRNVTGFSTTATPVNAIVNGIGQNRSFSGRVSRVGENITMTLSTHPGAVWTVPSMTRVEATSGTLLPIGGDSGGTIWRDWGGSNSNMVTFIGVLAAVNTTERTWFFSPLSLVGGNNFRPAID